MQVEYSMKAFSSKGRGEDSIAALSKELEEIKAHPLRHLSLFLCKEVSR